MLDLVSNSRPKQKSKQSITLQRMIPESDMNYQKHPAPWQLQGEGYMMPYRFRDDFLDQEACIPERLREKQVLKIGLVMLVNYHASPVGPYGELLFIPGMFRVNGKNYWHISKIYVSSMDSVMNGRENWGIPKELAQFEFNSMANGQNQVIVQLHGQKVFACQFKDWGIGLPLSTKLFPFNFYQPFQGKNYLTTPTGSGKAFCSSIHEMEIGDGLFPKIDTQTRLACLHIPDFTLAFPLPNFLT